MSTMDDSAELPFIVSMDTKRADPATRKRIRSHVMQGKNRGKTRYPKPAGHTGGGAIISTPETAVCPSSGCLSVIPGKVGSELSFIQLADTVEPPVLADLLNFSSIAKQALFPLETCVSFDKKDMRLVKQLINDAAYLHATIYAVQSYFEMLLVGHRTLTASSSRSLHFMKTLRLLRERLLIGKEEAKVSDSTVSVIMTLATDANLVGDYETAKHHVEGLRRIVHLRGGIASFEDNTKLLIEILRCDIGTALHSGAKPLFFSDSPFLEPLIPYSYRTGTQSYPGWYPECIDAGLVRAFVVMKKFCSDINAAAKAGHKVSERALLNTMASVMYRLLDMSFKEGALEEAIRLGILAFCSHIFLQWPNVRFSYFRFPEAYKNCLFNMKSQDSVSAHTWLWLLIVGALSIFSEHDDVWLKPWLRQSIESCGIKSWSEMRDRLTSFLWIGLVHDQGGKQIFDSALLSA